MLLLGQTVPHTSRHALLAPARLRCLCSTNTAALAPPEAPAEAEAEAEAGHSSCVEAGVKQRLDAFLAARIPGASRGMVGRAVKAGAVTVNGRPQLKPAFGVRAWDRVACELPPPAPICAEPEDIPLDVVYEDAHLLVINKAAGMVVHPSPGHERGTLVHALLHHCGLPAVSLTENRQATLALLGAAPGGEDGGELEDAEEEEDQGLKEDGDGEGWADSLALATAAGDNKPSSIPCQNAEVAGAGQPGADLPRAGQSGAGQQGQGGVGGEGRAAVLRPGIVHRLDKGTSGLLVVAKTEAAHAGLAEQFHARTVERRYRAVHLGVPKQASGRVETNIGRDVNHRKHMAVFAYQSQRGRHAVSTYSLLEPLAEGAASLLEWKLQTGRTHQIRLHAKYLGYPVLGDETYGGSGSPAAKLLGRIGMSKRCGDSFFDRPALHAQTLGFVHPATGEKLSFKAELPPDFSALLAGLRALQGRDQPAPEDWQQEMGFPLVPNTN